MCCITSLSMTRKVRARKTPIVAWKGLTHQGRPPVYSLYKYKVGINKPKGKLATFSSTYYWSSNSSVYGGALHVYRKRPIDSGLYLVRVVILPKDVVGVDHKSIACTKLRIYKKDWLAAGFK